MGKHLSSFVPSLWVKMFGPPKPINPPVFSHDQIITRPGDYWVGLIGQDYLYMFPMMVALITTQDGQVVPVKEGNYPPLPRGAHKLQYVDLREKTTQLRTTGPSAEGYAVRLAVMLTWKIADPAKVISIQEPVATLLLAGEAAIKRLIRSHQHDQLVCAEGNQLISDGQIGHFILEELKTNQACRCFSFVNIDVLERTGDPKVVEIQQTKQLQEKQIQSDLITITQQQRLAEQKKALVTTKGEVDREQVIIETQLAELQANFEARRTEILTHAQRLVAELERIREQPDRLHEQALKGLEVRKEALKSLIEAQRAGGFPRNYDDLRLIQAIVSSLPTYPAVASNSVMMLSSTLEGLMPPMNDLQSD